MLFTCGIWAAETFFFLRIPRPAGSFSIFWGYLLVWVPLSMWLYAPLVLLQSHTLKRALRRRAATLEDEGGIGNHSMELAAIFIGMKLLIMISALSPLHPLEIIQVCLVVYQAVRYARSLSKVIPKYVQLNRCADPGPINPRQFLMKS